MTLEEIQTDEALRRRDFPVVDQGVFLAHAAVSPLPRRVTESMKAYLDRSMTVDQEAALTQGKLQELRRQFGRLLGVDPAEVALVGPTSLGLSFVAAGLAFEPGDNVVAYPEDYPSNVYPWMALAERGVEMRSVETSELGRIELEDVARQVDERTRLVSLASAHFISGICPDLAAIGGFLQARGVRFCVDGIQTVGARFTDLSRADFMAADAHKWMLGPCAAGVLYVRRDLQEELRPATFGWHNVRCPDFITQTELTLRTDARRYEAGTANITGLVGLQAALEMIEELGLERIEEDLWRKRQWLVAELEEKGFTVLGATEKRPHTAGILSFMRGSESMEAIHRRLAQEGVTVSLRSDRAQRRYLRVSPHFYNTDAELRRFLELL